MTLPSDNLEVPIPLSTLLGDYPTTHALRTGALKSAALPLVFADVAVPNRAFKRAVRELEFDVTELALMTFLMARSRDVPLYLLPVVVFARNPLPYLVCDRERRLLRPDDLGGCRVGVRAYATTTAVWIRALLRDRFQVAFDDVKWITLEDGHVAGVPDPPSASRAGSSAHLVSMLRDGAVDAAIIDPVPNEPWLAEVVPDPASTYAAWRKQHGARTLNHIVAVRESVARDEPVTRELFRLFTESRDLAGVESRAMPFGLEDNRRNLEAAIAAASAQGLLARELTVAGLVTGALASLT